MREEGAIAADMAQAALEAVAHDSIAQPAPDDEDLAPTLPPTADPKARASNPGHRGFRRPGACGLSSGGC